MNKKGEEVRQMDEGKWRKVDERRRDEEVKKEQRKERKWKTKKEIN